MVSEIRSGNESPSTADVSADTTADVSAEVPGEPSSAAMSFSRTVDDAEVESFLNELRSLFRGDEVESYVMFSYVNVKLFLKPHLKDFRSLYGTFFFVDVLFRFRDWLRE